MLFRSGCDGCVSIHLDWQLFGFQKIQQAMDLGTGFGDQIFKAKGQDIWCDYPANDAVVLGFYAW